MPDVGAGNLMPSSTINARDSNPGLFYKVRLHGLAANFRRIELPNSCVHVYVHFVWRTWDSLPLISDDLRMPLYGAIAQGCLDVKCQAIEIGGIEDHVHVLVRMHATTAVSDVAKQMKGASSHLVTHVLKRGEFFKWQGSYGAFSVGVREVAGVIEYIRNQQTHHSRGSTDELLERCTEEDLPDDLTIA